MTTKVGPDYLEEVNQAEQEYLKVLLFKKGDSFEQHFQIKEEAHYWKTDSGMWLGSTEYILDGKSVISTFFGFVNADKFTYNQVAQSDFDINKVRICDEGDADD